MRYDERLDDYPAGVEVTLRVDLKNPRDFGYWLASRSSDKQADVLHGLYEGLVELDPDAWGKQLLYIRDYASEQGFDLSGLAEMFADYFGTDDV